ncbi:MAG: hypothetical protein M3Z26_09530 [Bacteroidota bacterium]|nr:hypothetical protein [Bacteroidota bacterium]
MQNEKESSEETITLIDMTSKDESIIMEKCCSECNCTGYDQDHGNICKCGHNSEKHTC